MQHSEGSSIEPVQTPPSTRPRIKICGVRSLPDASDAAAAGADYIGLLFVPGRRRRLDANTAESIVSGMKDGGWQGTRTVGLFADQPLEEVNSTVRRCGIDLVQLCGEEPMDYCAQVEAPLIKVVHVPEHLGPDDVETSLVSRLAELEREGYMITLDRKVEGLQGGTGQTFDWGVARVLSEEGFSFLLAGGLTPENVGEAVTIAHPWGVDVSGGVETGGTKDKDKVLAFVAAACVAADPIPLQ